VGTAHLGEGHAVIVESGAGQDPVVLTEMRAEDAPEVAETARAIGLVAIIAGASTVVVGTQPAI
jgi:hypothetical protein